MTTLHCWLDSSVALHWIRGGSEYRQFVANRIQKIQAYPEVTWHHVGTKENPADLGSRGGRVTDNKLWWSAPQWLGNKEACPLDIVTSETTESQSEAKATKEVFGGIVESRDRLDELLEKFCLRKAMRVCAWVSRFVHNSRPTKNKRITGPLKNPEIHDQHTWIKRARESQNQQSSED